MTAAVQVTVVEIDRDHELDGADDAVRAVLGAATGRAPADIRIRRGRNGKPEISHGPHFSVATRDGVCVVATCAAHPVGIDLERVPERLPTPLLELVLPADARQAVLAAAEPERPRQFALWWCRMTAAVRACGAGLDEAGACLAAAPQRVEQLNGELAVAVAAVDVEAPRVVWAQPPARQLVACGGVSGVA